MILIYHNWVRLNKDELRTKKASLGGGFIPVKLILSIKL